MAEIKGTIVNINDFLGEALKEVTIVSNDKEHTVFTLSKGRKYVIPEFQREIRWSKENLNILVQDIKDSNKFLGNIILAHGNDKEYWIIDGQQRLTILLMIIHFIKVKWCAQINEAMDFHGCKLEIKSFKAYEKLLEKNFDISSLSTEEKETDKYEQSGRYVDLWNFISDIKELQDKDTVRKFFKNLKRCTVNVILADKDSTDYNIDYFIDVNLKGVKLDIEDIFKGYLFHMSNSTRTMNSWIHVKQKAKEYNKKAFSIINKGKILSKDEDEIYSLVKMLYHYYFCDLFLDGKFSGMNFGSDFSLRKDYIAKTGQTYYKGEHLVKVVGDDSYMLSSLETLCKIIDIFNEIISIDEHNESFIKRFEREDSKEKVDMDTILIIKGLAKLLLLDEDITLPYALIMKFFLEVIKNNKKITNSYCEKFYSIYAFSVLFNIFVSKKEIPEVEAVLQSNSWHDELIKKLNNYFSKGKIAERRAPAQCKYIIDEATGVSSHKCRALAILYNYFTFDGEIVKIRRGKSNDIKDFLSDEDKYSLEHFVINNGEGFSLMNNGDKYSYPTDIKKYASSIFNYIFIPDTINGNLLKNYYILDKIELLSSHLKEIECGYSKMILENIVGIFDEIPLCENDAKIDVEKTNIYFAYNFKRQFINFSNKIIDKIIKKLKEDFFKN